MDGYDGELWTLILVALNYLKLLDISTTITIQNDQNVQIIVKSFVKIYLQDNSTKLCCIIMTFRLEAAR